MSLSDRTFTRADVTPATGRTTLPITLTPEQHVEAIRRAVRRHLAREQAQKGRKMIPWRARRA